MGSELTEIKHPVLDCMCRSDGAILVPASKRYGPPHWTYGYPDSKGYMQVSIHGKILKAHRVIAQAFLGDGGPGMVVDHIDRNPANNRVENLRWVTQKENTHNSERYERNTYGVHGDTPENKVLYALAYKKAHPESVKRQQKEYYARHRDEILKKAREKYALKAKHKYI